jgi:hypothetical protein
MWVVVSGVRGVGKRFILDYLRKEAGFSTIQTGNVGVLSGTPFERDISILKSQIAICDKIQSVSMSKKVASNCFILDTVFVHSKVNNARGEMSDVEFKGICDMAQSCLEKGFFPNAMLYVKPVNKMSCYNRMLLEGGRIDESRFLALSEAYEEYVKMLRIPVVEIYNSDNAGELIEQLKFNISSLNTSGLLEQGVWRRELFLEKLEGRLWMKAGIREK